MKLSHFSTLCHGLETKLFSSICLCWLTSGSLAILLTLRNPYITIPVSPSSCGSPVFLFWLCSLYCLPVLIQRQAVKSAYISDSCRALAETSEHAVKGFLHHFVWKSGEDFTFSFLITLHQSGTTRSKVFPKCYFSTSKKKNALIALVLQLKTFEIFTDGVIPEEQESWPSSPCWQKVERGAPVL